jgi:hypothetical protein
MMVICFGVHARTINEENLCSRMKLLMSSHYEEKGGWLVVVVFYVLKGV